MELSRDPPWAVVCLPGGSSILPMARTESALRRCYWQAVDFAVEALAGHRLPVQGPARQHSASVTRELAAHIVGVHLKYVPP